MIGKSLFGVSNFRSFKMNTHRVQINRFIVTFKSIRIFWNAIENIRHVYTSTAYDFFGVGQVHDVIRHISEQNILWFIIIIWNDVTITELLLWKLKLSQNRNVTSNTSNQTDCFINDINKLYKLRYFINFFSEFLEVRYTINYVYWNWTNSDFSWFLK